MATFQEGVLARNARLNALNTQLGATSTLKIFSGALPANCGAADPSGTTLCTITLPATPFAAASGGVMAMTGSWTVSASGTGTAASFRIYDSSSVCQQQGDVGTSGTAMILNNTSISSGQTVTVSTYSITAGNA